MNYPKNWNFVNKENRVLFYKKCGTSSKGYVDVFVKSDGAFIFENKQQRGTYINFLTATAEERNQIVIHKIAEFRLKTHNIHFSDLAFELLNSESFVDIIKIISFIENKKHKKRTA